RPALHARAGCDLRPRRSAHGRPLATALTGSFEGAAGFVIERRQGGRHAPAAALTRRRAAALQVKGSRIRMSRVDPPDYPAWPTARRLLRLWWEQRRLGIRGLVCAFAYTGVSLTIPLLIQRAIDNAVVHHEHALWPYLAAIVLLAALRMAINFTRRYATARIGIRIEARMRELLYQAYLLF